MRVCRTMFLRRRAGNGIGQSDTDFRSITRALWGASGRRASPTEESAMKNTKNALFVLCFVPFLTMPAFAGSVNAGNKPIVVAEDVHVGVDGVGIGGGERDRHRDH